MQGRDGNIYRPRNSEVPNNGGTINIPVVQFHSQNYAKHLGVPLIRALCEWGKLGMTRTYLTNTRIPTCLARRLTSGNRQTLTNYLQIGSLALALGLGKMDRLPRLVVKTTIKPGNQSKLAGSCRQSVLDKLQL